MNDLIYFGPDKYYNLKADLIARNKIDGVIFELNEISEAFGQQYGGDFELYKNASLETDEKILKRTQGDESLLIAEIRNLFAVNKRVEVINNSNTYYLALEIKPDNRLVYKPRYKVIAEKIRYRNQSTVEENISDFLNNHTEITIPTFTNDTVNIQYIDDSKINIFFKTSLFASTNQYTKKISIVLEAEGWSADKKTYAYMLDGGGNLEEVTQGSDGSFNRRMEFPFTYPVTDLLQPATRK